jgi:hypothetical protein
MKMISITESRIKIKGQQCATHTTRQAGGLACVWNQVERSHLVGQSVCPFIRLSACKELDKPSKDFYRICFHVTIFNEV